MPAADAFPAPRGPTSPALGFILAHRLDFFTRVVDLARLVAMTGRPSSFRSRKRGHCRRALGELATRSQTARRALINLKQTRHDDNPFDFSEYLIEKIDKINYLF
jgi:hypothetical protein